MPSNVEGNIAGLILRAFTTSSDHVLRAILNKSVPAAPALSVAYSPVSLNLT